MSARYVITLEHPRTEKIRVTVTADNAVRAKREAGRIGWPYAIRPMWVVIESVEEVQP